MKNVTSRFENLEVVTDGKRTVKYTEGAVVELLVGIIDPNPNQPRKEFPEEYIAGLAASIKKRGLLQPILVRPKVDARFEICAGECRWRAHVSMKAKTIRAIIETMTDAEMRLRSIVENLQRRNMNPIEEAMAYQSLVADGYTWQRIAAELGLKGTAIVRNRVRLIENLAPEIQGKVASGRLSSAMADGVAWVPKDRQSILVRDIEEGKYKTSEQVRHAAMAIREACATGAKRAAIATERDLETVKVLETRVDRLANIAGAGFADGEVAAAERVAAHRVSAMVGKLQNARRQILSMEHDLARVAVQTEAAQGVS